MYHAYADTPPVAEKPRSKEMIQLSEKQEAQAMELHRKALVIDALASSYSITEAKYFQKLKDGGVDMASVTVGGSSLRETTRAAAQMLATIRDNSDQMVQVTTAAEMRQAKREGKVAVVFSTQNGSCLEGDPALLEVYHRLGYRIMGITYSGANFLGGGCAELTREVQGLTFVGMEVLQEMNRLGILIDASHSGDATTWDILKLSKDPAVFTHSNARALADTARNKPDDQIKAMANTGGVMGVAPVPRMVNDDMRKATLEGLLDHIDYIVGLVGVDHVGLGLDFTDATERYTRPIKEPWMIWRDRRPEMLGTWEDFFSVPYARDIDDHTKVPNLVRGLVVRGYSDEDILKILGGNWLRVFEKVTEK
jgi:membrane dipeptidase